MSILSKTWLRSWLTHPNIEFKINYRFANVVGNLEIVDTIMDRYRDEKIPIDRFELSYDFFSQVSAPTDKWLDIALQNDVKSLCFKVHNFSWPIFKILAAKSLRELVVKCCTFMPVSSSSGVTNCNSLRKLSLTYVNLDENMLQIILNCCPLIVDFIFEYCWGLEKIELLNLQKIKSLSIKRESNQLVEIRAPTLEHLSYEGYSSKKLDIVECQNLKSLDISHVTISDGFLENLISGSQSLKDLKIQYCGGILEIDSSNLESLEYMGYTIPQLKIARESRNLKHSKIVLHCLSKLNAAWFYKLRMFLSNSTSWQQVSLHLSQCNEIINMTDLQVHHGVATPKVDVLNVNSTWMNGECPTFVDALLWSFHPRILNIRSTSATFTCFINSLMYMKNLSQLKGAQVNIFDDNKSQSWHPVELNTEQLGSKTVKYSFLLDWLKPGSKTVKYSYLLDW